MNTLKNNRWEIVIGFETHVQLKTASKIFSGASTQFGAQPNTKACAIDLALPGVLPVINKSAVEHAIRFGLAVGARIAPRSVFDRKNYFYPDLPKGYQISQFEIPIVQGGSITFYLEQNGTSTLQTVQLNRAHLEEDAGKSLHENYQGMSGIDLNRAGTPLLEIVTEPDMRSATQAVSYARTLHALVTWLDICDGNMQEGSFRCDANVSVRPVGQQSYGTRCEIKNLNSFRFMEDAINYEVARQIELIEDGEVVVQATRLYDPDKKETRTMRTKEDAQDYRYFPDPDLPPLFVSESWIEIIRKNMPELPQNMRQRFISQYQLSPYDASLLTDNRAMASYFEEVLAALNATNPSKITADEALISHAKLVANWINCEVNARLNRDGLAFSALSISAKQFSLLLSRILDNTLSNKLAKEVFAAMWHEKSSDDHLADLIIKDRNLSQMVDSSALESVVDQILSDNFQLVEQFKAGKEKAFNALIGKAMKASNGKANPAQLTTLLNKKLHKNN